MAWSSPTPQPYQAPEYRLTFTGLVRSEWIKF